MGCFFFFWCFIAWNKKECLGIEKNISKNIKSIIRLCRVQSVHSLKKPTKDYKNTVYPDCQWLQSGMFIPDPDLSIPDPGSNNSNKRDGEKISFPTFFVAQISQNLK
jgi:hypothetical protein